VDATLYLNDWRWGDCDEKESCTRRAHDRTVLGSVGSMAEGRGPERDWPGSGQAFVAHIQLLEANGWDRPGRGEVLPFGLDAGRTRGDCGRPVGALDGRSDGRRKKSWGFSGVC
jgi:hypothetical protein